VRAPKSFLSAASDSRTAKSALLDLAALGVGGAIVMSPATAHAAGGAAAKIASRRITVCG
jgi:hypothetical protein